MRDYTNEDVTACVQEVFRTPAGQLVLEWLEDVYVNYSARALVSSAIPNVERGLTWKAAQQDLVLHLRSIYEDGLPTLADNVEEDPCLT